MGLLLRPFSLGHFVLLERRGLLGADLTPLQLPQAVLICCQGWQENLAQPFDWLLQVKLAIWNWRSRGCDLFTETTRFARYVEEGNQSFRMAEPAPRPGPAPRPAGAPYILRLQQWLMLHLRLSEPEAWDYPLGLAKLRWAAYWEMEGALEVWNEQDQTFEDYVAKMEAQGSALDPAGRSPAPHRDAGASLNPS